MFTVHGKHHPLRRSEFPRLYLPSLNILQAVVVSKQGLENWLARNQTRLPQSNDEGAEVPEEIPISDITCEHGALDPSKASSMKCVNEVSADSTVRYHKSDHKIRVLTTRSWPPGATSRHCSTPITSVQSASPKRTKVRVPPTINSHLGIDSSFV